MLFIHLYKVIFFAFFVFLICNDEKLNILSIIKKMTIKELKKFIYENCNGRIGFQ